MERAILGAKELIKAQINGITSNAQFLQFREFGKNYFWTNEDIAGYLNLIDFEDKTDALSVLASGDHAFNLVTKGILDIDTFDINALSEYIALGLKRAAILKFNYNEFIEFMDNLCAEETPLDILTDMIEILLPYMESKHKSFWEQILDYNYKLQKEYKTNFNLINLLCRHYICIDHYNNYLNRENYDILKSRLANANISFKCTNSLNLPNEFNNQYDFLLLSNILDYYYGYWSIWNYEKLKEYENTLDTLIKNDGVIFLHYVFSFDKKDPLFNGSMVFMNDLADEKLHYIFDDKNVVDAAVILKRVKHNK